MDHKAPEKGSESSWTSPLISAGHDFSFWALRRDASPAPRKPEDARPVRLTAIAFVGGLVVFAACAYWGARVAETRNELRFILVAAVLPAAIALGTLRQLVYRQWKRSRDRQSGPPRRTRS